MQNLFDDDKDENDDRSADPFDKRPEPFTLSDPYPPENADETIRRSGLAWSVGIAFFASIVIMLFFGWLVDLSLGTSPWGKVGGIVLGSIIGFIQLFRITSQIFGPDTSAPAEKPLLSQREEPIVRHDRFDKH